MCRKNCVLGYCVISFSVGMLIGYCIESWFWCFGGAVGLVALGFFLLRRR